MRLVSRLIWRLTNFDRHSFSVKLQSAVLIFCHLTSFLGVLLFSVKSSWEVHWIVMFQKDAVWYVEFEKIGSFFQWFMKCPKAQRFSRSLFLLYIYFFFLFFCNHIVVALQKFVSFIEKINTLRVNISVKVQHLWLKAVYVRLFTHCNGVLNF